MGVRKDGYGLKEIRVSRSGAGYRREENVAILSEQTRRVGFILAGNMRQLRKTFELGGK